MHALGYRLVIGDKNYSSWSLRPWLAMRVFAMPFDEVTIELGKPDSKARILEHSPSGKVPALKIGGDVVWDSLAILDHLADTHPDLPLWPVEPRARARARAVSAEMHSGFFRLRDEMPMDFISRTPAAEISDRVAADISRIVEIWRQCRSEFGEGGPLLFGAFSIPDAMYAPVVSRFVTYGVDLAAHGDDGTAAGYCDTIMGLPEVEEWRAGAERELAARGAR